MASCSRMNYKFVLQIPATTGEFELRISCVRSSYGLIRKLKRKKPYLFTLDKREEKQMDFDWNCLFGKSQPSQLVVGTFQPSQLVCTPRSRRCKIRCSRKAACANNIHWVYRVMQSQHNVVRGTSG